MLILYFASKVQWHTFHAHRFFFKWHGCNPNNLFYKLTLLVPPWATVFLIKGHLKECLTIHVLLPFDYCFGRRTIVKFPPILGTDAVS